MMAQMNSGKPTTKVVVTSLAAALSTIIASLIFNAFPELDFAKAELVGLITAVVGYYTPPSPSDTLAE